MREGVVDLVERREMFLSLLGRVEEYLIVLCFRCCNKHASNTPPLFLVLWLSYDVRHTFVFPGLPCYRMMMMQLH